METWKIRKYLSKDKEAIRKICMDTSDKKFNVKPKDRQAMCLLFIDYFLDWEEENTFVVVDENDTPHGYIVCSSNSKLYEEKNKEIYLPALRKISFFYSLFGKICLSSTKRINRNINNCLHINLDKQYQGKGIGCYLLTGLGLYLKEKGQKEMYLITKNTNTRGYPFYRHFGFVEEKRFFGGIVLKFSLSEIQQKTEKYSIQDKIAC